MLILKPSPIHGIGIFTTTPLKKGTRLPLSATTRDWKVTRRVRGRFARYGVKRKDGQWYVPRDPCLMSIGWYLNHSDAPNLDIKTDDKWRTIHYVRAGEELTIDYDTLLRTE